MKTENNFSTLIVTVENKPGVLFKIAGLIRRRRFNIESLTVSHIKKEKISRFTILVRGEKEIVEKVSKQLYRVIEVLKVHKANSDEIVARELALIKVSIKKENSLSEISAIASHFRAKIINIHPEYMILETTGSEEKIDALYENMKKYGILEFARTGRTAMMK